VLVHAERLREGDGADGFHEIQWDVVKSVLTAVSLLNVDFALLLLWHSAKPCRISNRVR
jgi:hypothetical protein